MLTPWLPLLILAASATHARAGEKPVAQYIRIELYGEGRILSLAEVEVFSLQQNVAPKGTATASSSDHGGVPTRAIDGVLNGVRSAGSVSQTNAETDPWWEVNLGAPLPIDQVTVWNRTDCCAERLADYALVLLDSDRAEVSCIRPNPPPAPYRDHILSGGEPSRSRASLARKHQLQIKINAAIDSGVEYLKRTQLRDGSWLGNHYDRNRNGSVALCGYALVKSGVDADDPCILRAINYLKQTSTEDTYSAGCVLMFLHALDDEEHFEWAEEVAEFLLDVQGGKLDGIGVTPGLWSYSVNSGDTPDLSNTQYGALGLRAAASLGVKIPNRAWERLIDDTLKLQGDPEILDPPGGFEGRSTTGYGVAPFRYRGASAENHGPNGSMTTAGIACLAIASHELGSRIGAKRRRATQKGIDYGMHWLALHFSGTTNPGGGTAWHRYYLYGLERVGAFLDIQHIGPHDWYEAGATDLTASQSGNGSWSNKAVQTCFALLFLNKATASSTGGRLHAAKISYAAEDPDHELHLRGSGVSPLTVWLSGFPEWVVEDFTPSAEFAPQIARGLRLVRIEYSIDDKVVASIPGDPSRAWRGERYPFRHSFDTRGEYEVTARAFVLGPDAMPGDADGIKELASGSFSVEVEGLFEDWMLEYSLAGTKNLLSTVNISVEVSSDRSRGEHADAAEEAEARARAAAATIDGHEFTHWLCSPSDEKPTLTARLDRPVRARRLLLSPAGSSVIDAASYDRIVRARVTFNGKEDLAYEILFPTDTLQKGILELPRALRVRSFRIEILERVKQDENHGMAGFSAISLER